MPVSRRPSAERDQVRPAANGFRPTKSSGLRVHQPAFTELFGAVEIQNVADRRFREQAFRGGAAAHEDADGLAVIADRCVQIRGRSLIGARDDASSGKLFNDGHGEIMRRRARDVKRGPDVARS